MFGVVLATAAGIMLSFADAGKKTLARSLPPEVLLLLMQSFGIVVNLIYLSCYGFPAITWSSVWLPALLCGSLAAVGELLFMYGLRDADLSIAMPLFASLPIFSLVVGYVLFGEIPSPLGGLGALTIVVGAYLLNVKLPLHTNAFLPFVRVFTDRACVFILGSALIGATIFVGQRYGVQHSSPVPFFTMILVVNWLIFFAITVYRGRFRVSNRISPKSIVTLIGTGVLWAVGLTCLFASYNYTLAVYAGSAMQIQTFVSITLGALLFGEPSYLKRMGAGVVIVAGVIMITLAARV